MADIPRDLRYTKDHEWVRADGDRWRIGITRFATDQLGDIVLVEMPKVDTALGATESFGTIESVKSVSELFAPVSGKVVGVNEELGSSPELVNTDPYGDGWIIDIEPSDRKELDELLTADAYAALIAQGE